MSDIFNNARILADEVKRSITTGIDLIARPANRFKPDDTLWWLVPSTEFPAYKYGKIFFEKKEKGMFCGFQIEKGVSTDNETHLPSLQINRDWLWNEFMEALRNGDSSILKNLAPKKFKSYLVVSAGIVPAFDNTHPEMSENFKDTFVSSKIEYEIDKNLELHFKEEEFKPNDKQEKIAEYFKNKLKEETDISKLATKVSNGDMPDFNWSWIDVYFGTYIPVEQNDMTVAELWRDYLEQWVLWLKKHED